LSERWTEPQMQQLAALVAARMEVGDIAALTGRTIAALHTRLSLLGLHLAVRNGSVPGAAGSRITALHAARLAR
jgi:hypothetical protein